MFQPRLAKVLTKRWANLVFSLRLYGRLLASDLKPKRTGWFLRLMCLFPGNVHCGFIIFKGKCLKIRCRERMLQEVKRVSRTIASYQRGKVTLLLLLDLPHERGHVFQKRKLCSLRSVLRDEPHIYELHFSSTFPSTIRIWTQASRVFIQPSHPFTVLCPVVVFIPRFMVRSKVTN